MGRSSALLACLSGKPRADLAPQGRQPAHAALAAEALTCAGLPGPRPAQRFLSQMDSEAAACPPCHVWLANTFPSDLSSFCTVSLPHAILHCQQSSLSSPAAPRPTSSITAWKEPGESSAQHAAKQEAPEPVWQRLCRHRPTSFPTAPWEQAWLL